MRVYRHKENPTIVAERAYDHVDRVLILDVKTRTVLMDMRFSDLDGSWELVPDVPKRYLLLRGAYYYPRSETGDWVGCYTTKEEAEAALEKAEAEEVKAYGDTYDTYRWSTIVDLYQWLYSNGVPDELV
jgi:hypothetical protein